MTLARRGALSHNVIHNIAALHFRLGTGRSISSISTLIFKGDMSMRHPFRGSLPPLFRRPPLFAPPIGRRRREEGAEPGKGKEDFPPVFERPLAPSSVLMAVHHLGRYRLCSTPKKSGSSSSRSQRPEEGRSCSCPPRRGGGGRRRGWKEGSSLSSGPENRPRFVIDIPPQLRERRRSNFLPITGSLLREKGARNGCEGDEKEKSRKGQKRKETKVMF